jgi:hypothetical protein
MTGGSVSPGVFCEKHSLLLCEQNCLVTGHVVPFCALCAGKGFATETMLTLCM